MPRCLGKYCPSLLQQPKIAKNSPSPRKGWVWRHFSSFHPKTSLSFHCGFNSSAGDVCLFLGEKCGTIRITWAPPSAACGGIGGDGAAQLTFPSPNGPICARGSVWLHVPLLAREGQIPGAETASTPQALPESGVTPAVTLVILCISKATEVPPEELVARSPSGVRCAGVEAGSSQRR